MNFNKKFAIQKQNIAVFVLTSFIAFQALYLTETYKINYPYAYDMTSLNIYIDYFEKNEGFSIKIIERLLSDTNSRAIIAPKLLVAPNYLLNNFDSGNIFYIGWVILVLTLFIIFLIIRDQNKKLYWTLIPISAFIFSPLINNNYWNYSILIWYLPALCIVTAIYLLNKKQNLKNITGVLMLSLIATYSIPLGLTVWIAGSVSILKKYIGRNITTQILIIYFSTMIVVGIIYYSGNIQQQKIIPSEQLINIRTVYVIATFLAVPFKLKFDALMIIVGIVSISTSIILVYYLGILRKKINDIFPWILFLSVAFTGAIIMRIGRFNEYFEGNLPYYSPIAGLFQIGITVLTAYTILEIKKNDLVKNKKFILILLYSIIILQILFLIPSYYNGWWKADYYYKEKIDHIECFSLHYAGHECDDYYIKSFDRSENSWWYNTFVILNYFIKNNSNLFSDPDFNKKTIKELDEFSKKITQVDIKKIDGKITKINNIEGIKEYTVKDEQALFLSGFIIEKNVEDIHAIYLTVDGQAAAKFDSFNYSDNAGANNMVNEKLEWNIGILKSYLQKGCKIVSIEGIKNNEPFGLNDTVKVCIE